MGKRVIVVDDNLDAVMSMITLLGLEGHQAKGFGNAVGIVEEILEFDADAVVLDIVMPQKSGWDAAREIRQKIPGQRPVLIAVSGEYAGDAKKVTAMEGFNYFLMKPVDPKVLTALLEKS